MNKENNIPEHNFETIERYLNHEMNAEERAAFGTKINEDPILAAQVEEVKETILGIESAALKEKLDAFHEATVSVKEVKTIQSEKRNISKRLVQFLVAASIIAFGVFWFVNQGSASDKLYAKHFTPDPGLPTTMSTTADYQFYDAMVDYKTQDYNSAIRKWELLLPEKSMNDTLNYFLGVANLANGDEEKALSFLTIAVNKKDSFLKSDAHYYLGLAYLKNNNLDKARDNFKLSGSEKSKKILIEMKN